MQLTLQSYAIRPGGINRQRLDLDMYRYRLSYVAPMLGDIRCAQPASRLTHLL